VGLAGSDGQEKRGEGGGVTRARGVGTKWWVGEVGGGCGKREEGGGEWGKVREKGGGEDRVGRGVGGRGVVIRKDGGGSGYEGRDMRKKGCRGGGEEAGGRWGGIPSKTGTMSYEHYKRKWPGRLGKSGKRIRESPTEP